MDASNLWWMLCASAVLVELLSGTFYLLMLALGLAAAALSAHAGLAAPLQMLVAAGISGAAVGLLWLARRHRNGHNTPDASKDLHLDIGEIVEVLSWDAQHHADVQYRGAQWAASLQAADPGANGPAPSGPHRIVAVVGNRLMLTPLEPP